MSTAHSPRRTLCSQLWYGGVRGGKSPLSNELGGFAGKVLDYLTATKYFMTSYTGVYQNSRRPLPPPPPLWNKCEGAGTVGCRGRRKVGSECLREKSAGAEDVLVTLRFYFQECKPFLQIFTRQMTMQITRDSKGSHKNTPKSATPTRLFRFVSIFFDLF